MTPPRGGQATKARMHLLRHSDRLLAHTAATLQSTVAADPDNAAALQRLGDVYRGLGKLREALECYRRVVALRPGEPKAVRLAAILSEQALPDAPLGARPMPFARVADFLPDQRCRELLALAISSRDQFEPAQVLGGRLNLDARKCLVADYRLTDRKVRPWLEARLRRAFARALPRLQLREPSRYWIEMRMSAYLGSGFFVKHADDPTFRSRKVSFVYYFHRQPRRFSGGDLLLHDGDGTQAFTRIEPRHNSIVFFPSDYVHEVVAVDSDSADFTDARFAVHGWLRTDVAGRDGTRGAA